MGNKKKGKILAVLLSGALLGTQIPGMTVAEGAVGDTEIERVSLSETETEALMVQTGIAAVGSADSEPSAKTTETGDEGTDEDETDSETSTEKTTETGTEGTSTGTDSETSTEKTTETGTEGTSAGETDSETKESTEKTTEAGPEGTDEDETDSESETSTEKNAEAGPEGTDEDETDSETETSTEETPDSDAEMETDEVVAKVQAMIEALPSVEEVEQMSPEEQKEVYNDAQDAADAYFDELTEEQKGQVDLKKLMDLMNFFNGQVSTMATGYTLTNGVLTITSSAGLISFQGNTNIKSIIITGDVNGSIGEYAFNRCSNLTSVTIETGANITSIGESAFSSCSNLTSVTIETGANITSIGEYAFYCSNLTSVTIPSSVTSIGKGAFNRCSNLTSVMIETGANITSIGERAFYACSNLTSVAISQNVTIGSIGSYAFSGCSNLTSVAISQNVTIGSIGSYAFSGCSGLTSITIPDSVTSIGESAFNGCSGLTSITIPDSVTSIGGSAFNGCSGLTSITIPDSVTSIGSLAFYKCTSLTEVTLPATAPSVGSNPFYKAWDNADFKIPETSIGTENGKYNLNASPWNQIVMLNGSRLIRSVAVILTEPVGGSVLPATASCTTTGVESSSVSWTSNGTPVEDGAKAGYGESYTAGITLTALTSTDTSDTSQSYRFVDGISATLNGAAVTATVSDSGKTLTFSKTYQTKQAQDSPNISIDYQNEKLLNTTTSMEYSTDEGEKWSDCSEDMKVTDLLTNWDGTKKTVQIRMKETAIAYASDPASVTIPARPAVTVSQTTGSTTASSLTVSASVSGIPAGESPEVQYQLVAGGGNVDENNWQVSGAFMNLKAGTAYTAYAKCGATSSSFASDISSGQQVSTSAAAYTVTIPSATLTAGDSTSKAEISVDRSENFDLGYNGQVQVKVKNNEAVSTDGKLTLTRQGASDTLTSAMYINGKEFTNIDKPVAVFKMDNYNTAKEVVSFAQPTGTQEVIPAGTYSGTVTYEVTYSEQEGGTE